MTNRSSGLFNRPPRLQPAPIGGEIQIPAPPKSPDEHARSLLLSLLPFSSLLIMGGFYLIIGANTGRSPLYTIPLLAMGIVSAVTSLLTYSYQKQLQRKRFFEARRDYHRQLDKREARLQAAHDVQLAINRRKYPGADVIPSLIESRHDFLWSRRIADDDFGWVRLGVGDIPSNVIVQSPDPDLEALDIQRAVDLSFKYRLVRDTSVTLNLLQWGAMGIVGSRADLLPFTYAVLAHLTTEYAPTDVSLYIFSSRAVYLDWSWARWLPHTSQFQKGGFPDYLAFDPEASRDLLNRLNRRLEERHAALENTEGELGDTSLIVVLVDETSSIRDELAYRSLLSSRQAGIITLSMVNDAEDVPGECNGVVTVLGHAFRVHLTGPEGIVIEGTADALSRAQAEMIARKLTNYRLPQLGASQRIPTRLDFLQMFGNAASIEALDIPTRWNRLPKDGRLPFPAPIGGDSYSSQLSLDLSENVHGPHGLVAGTTGAGKSELLQTIVCALAVEHHPYFLNFLLIDYKGGATFGFFEHLPHTTGLITNLDKAEALRALEAIKSEIRRRQQFLREQGAQDITDYHKRLDGCAALPADWKPLPHLLIIIDEFAELKTDLPNFLHELVSTVRVGRSLGIHLILATQRPSGHITAEMAANLQFRICLRVQSPDASREVLLRPDAAYLPVDVIGRAYFQVGTDTRQFQVAYSGMKYKEREESDQDRLATTINLRRFERVRSVTSADEGEIHTPDSGNDAPARKFAMVLTDRLSDVYEATRLSELDPVLLPSLPARFSLDDIRQFTDQDSAWSWDGTTWRDDPDWIAWIEPPVGLIDDINSHTQPPLTVDFRDASGHLLIVGPPASGKSTFLRTLTLSLAQRCPPRQLEIYIVSMAGRNLDPLAALPHVGAVINAEESERLARLLHRLQDVRQQRRSQFALLHAESLEHHNSRVPQDQRQPAIVILIDNFLQLRETYPAEMETIVGLMQDGRAYGIHFVLTSPSPQVPVSILNLVSQKLVLPFSEKLDYQHLIGRSDRELASRPGSVLIRNSVSPTPLHGQIALPATSPAGETPGAMLEDLGNQVDDELRNEQMIATIAQMAAAWGQDPAATPIKTLPERVSLDGADGLLAVVQPAGQGSPPFEALKTPIALDDLSLRTFTLDWLQHGPHLLINSPQGSGKSTLLSTLLLSTAWKYAPDHARILLVDFGRGLRRLRHLPHVIAYVTNEDELGENLSHLMAELEWRRQTLDAAHAHSGSSLDLLDADDSYQFPPIIIAIDDYDQMSEAISQYGYMLDELSRRVRRDSDLGFHLLISGVTQNLMRGDQLLKQLRLMRTGVALGSADAIELLGGKVTSAMRKETLPEGRGYLVLRGRLQRMQFAQAYTEANTIRTIRDKRWAGKSQAVWERKASREIVSAFKEHVHQATSAGPILDWDLEGAIEDYKRQQGYTSTGDH